MQDTLFAQPFATPLDQTVRFSFDEQVAACFPDMIRRSVPGYGQMLAMLPILAAPHCALRQKNADGQAVSRIYDLGCSLGAASLALVQHFAPNRLQIYALDNSAAMIGKAQTIAQQYDRAHEIIFQCTDITTEPLQTCDVIVLNLTLQFIAPAKRLLLLKKCHQALAKGGILLLSEKIHVPNQQDEAWFVGRYYDFKRQNGYSELEISAKRDALDEVLITDTLEAHHWRLQQAGFSKSLTWFRFLNFASLVAFKE